MVVVKSLKEMEEIRKAGEALGPIFDYLKPYLKPGVSTWEVDRLAEAFIRQSGYLPSFKGYEGFPASVCASVGDEVIHGIPSKKRILKEGDLLKIDVGNLSETGFQSDCARTFAIGEVSPRAKALAEAAEDAFWEVYDAIEPGVYVNDLGAIVERVASQRGFSALKEYGGHGIGRKMHEDPFIPNCARGFPPHRGAVLKAGMAVCVEPMLLAGKPAIALGEDGWTVFSQDGSLGAHYENTILIYEDRTEVVTIDLEARERLEVRKKGDSR